MADKTLEEKLEEHMDNVQPTTETPEVPEKVKVGDAEYTQEELSKLVGIGKIGAEMEEKWDSPISSLYPNYSRAQNQIKEMEDKLKEAQSKIPEPTATPDEEQDKEALRILKDKFGVVTKGDLEDYYKSRREQEKVEGEQEAYAKDLSSKVATLQKEVDGTDGRPAFKPVEVLTFMKEEGIKDPMKAYKVMHEDALDAWKAEKIVKGELKDPIVTVTKPTAGAKQPTTVRPNRENLQQMLNDALPDR